jgi:pimeloyl-ACP methyl ester carboxylesterase
MSISWVSVLGGLAVTPVLAFALALWPWRKAQVQAIGLDFSQTLLTRHAPLSLGSLSRRDGTAQAFRWASGPSDGPLVVMIHGSGWHGMQFEGLAARLSEVADVVVPDLRGHGPNPTRRGDIDYIGQFEDDLADLIAARAKPGQKVVILGHSSGGGLVVRFAGGKYRGLMSAAVLLAPFLHHAAPTTRKSSGGWARVNLRRMIGLSILNSLQIKGLNHLPVIRFAMPEAVLKGPLGATATVEYSYRLNCSFAPRANWKRDVAALPTFLVVAGRQDEAFFADRYEDVMSALTANGRYTLIDGLGHLDVVDAPQTAAAVRAFISEVA